MPIRTKVAGNLAKQPAWCRPCWVQSQVSDQLPGWTGTSRNDADARSRVASEQGAAWANLHWVRPGGLTEQYKHTHPIRAFGLTKSDSQPILHGNKSHTCPAAMLEHQRPRQTPWALAFIGCSIQRLEVLPPPFCCACSRMLASQSATSWVKANQPRRFGTVNRVMATCPRRRACRKDAAFLCPSAATNASPPSKGPCMRNKVSRNSCCNGVDGCTDVWLVTLMPVRFF